MPTVKRGRDVRASGMCCCCSVTRVRCRERADNTYADGLLPSLRVAISPSAIRFDNNEAGFSEKNVLALCSIGKSTKAASDPRYIGNKGVSCCSAP